MSPSRFTLKIAFTSPENRFVSASSASNSGAEIPIGSTGTSILFANVYLSYSASFPPSHPPSFSIGSLTPIKNCPNSAYTALTSSNRIS
jgi:hypothetical protein